MDKQIQRPVAKPNPTRVRFSFEHFQPDHSKFPISTCSKEFYEAFFREICRFQAWTIDDFCDQANAERRHQIYFPDTTEPDGFPDLDPAGEDLWTEEPWQFGLPGERGTPSDGWRVHGFINLNTFYVVWLDPHHRLNSPNSKLALEQ